MHHVRALFRILALTLLCSVMYVYLALTAGCLWLFERATGRAGLAARWRTRVFRRWAAWVGAVIGMRAQVHGAAPSSPFFLVANHLSYIDVILLASHVPAVFVSRADVRNWPAIGALCRLVDTLFIDRARKRDIPRIAEEMQRVLDGGRGIVIFPEGTSSRGDAVGPFRPSLLEVPASSRQPVSFASLSYRTPRGCTPAERAVCWWGGMGFFGHIYALLGLPNFRASLVFGEEQIVESDRKILASRLRQAVAAKFETMPRSEHGRYASGA